MKKDKKRLWVVMMLIALVIPAWAVFNESDIAKTLSILRSELHQEYVKLESRQNWIKQRNEIQHRELVEMTKRCNELALMLYSQSQDYTFDMTYALDEVTREYENYHNQRRPFDEIVANLSMEIERCEHLAESLRRLPPMLDTVIPGIPDSLSSVMNTLLLSGNILHYDEDSPFFLDEQGQIDRDSCLYYTLILLDMYKEAREKVTEDGEHYKMMSIRLDESYNYAVKRYRLIQKHIFIDGQDNYIKVLKSFPRYRQRAVHDAAMKYGIGETTTDSEALRQSDWRGAKVSGFIVIILVYIGIATLLSSLIMRVLKKKVARFQTDESKERNHLVSLFGGVLIFMLSVMIASAFTSSNFFKVASGLLLTYAWLVAAILLSLLIRIQSSTIRKVWKLYLPMIVLSLIVITFRIIFIPNKLVNLIFPPIVLACTIWQLFICRKINRIKEARHDMTYSWITLGVMIIGTIVIWSGYVLLGIQIFIWWLFQLAAIETITALYVLLDRYDEKTLKNRKLEYKKDHTIYEPNRKDAYIAVTWRYDLIRQVVLPVLAILTIPMCLFYAGDVFDLGEISKDIFTRSFFNLVDKDGSAILNFSLYNITLVAIMVFLFKYISYIAKALYRKIRYDSLSHKQGKTYFQANEINFTLADNVIGIVVWGSFIIITVVVLKIPIGALSIIAAGLATGLGLAMKDILNNFIYGIQLMGGRLRVGDYIECDGIRGKVTAISYQTTQIQTLEDTVIAFTNTTLFNKNFKNLTKNGNYEFLKIIVGVKYGTDVEVVRTLLMDATTQLQTKDNYNRPLVDPKRGISVTFDSFGDSSVNIALKQYVLVEERYAYIARAQELIYNTLNENNIEIPFPQRDVWIKQG
jgi:small-conductance mechanosensitive channel